MSTFRASRRAAIDGWALMVQGASKPLPNTLSTTRKEARAARDELCRKGHFRHIVVLVVPVHVQLVVAGPTSRRGKANAARTLLPESRP